jgi:protein-disulfide isomerase
MTRANPLVLVLIAVAAITVSAQTRRRPAARTSSTKPATADNAAAKPAPTPATTPTPTASDSPALATVNELTFTASDIEAEVSAAILSDPDLYLHDFYQDREKAIREARQRAVEVRVNSMLIAAEAKKRGMPADQLLEAEINQKIPPPTDAEIQAVFDANRGQLGNELAAVRPNIINYLRGQRMEQARADFVTRLKMTNTVMKGADVNAPNLAPGTVLASVNGQPLRIESINERMKAYIYQMDMRIYEARQQALDHRINNTLIADEANKKQIASDQIYRTEVSEKIKPATEAEITKFYEENKARLNGDLATNRAAIAEYLQQEQQKNLEKALADRLRATAKVQIFLKPPSAPIFNVVLAKGYSRGNINSPVKVVEFTDFQCSACGAMYPVLETVLKSYGDRVYFEVRNFPLMSLHENAWIAAQAAAAANAQGKVWPYIDLLFKNQTSLDAQSLKKFATQAGLDRARFDADFDSGKYESDIRRDIEEGETYGIEATPTIFINGVMLTKFSEAGVREAIDKAFAASGKSQ